MDEQGSYWQKTIRNRCLFIVVNGYCPPKGDTQKTEPRSLTC